MEPSTIVLIIAGIIVGIVVIRLLMKISAKVIMLLLVLAAAAYFLFFYEGGLLFGNRQQFVLYAMEEKYCQQESSSATCTCIIQPLIHTIEDNYSRKEIASFPDHSVKSSKVIMSAIQNKRDEIKKCLKENNETHLWKEFKNKLQERLGDQLNSPKPNSTN